MHPEPDTDPTPAGVGAHLVLFAATAAVVGALTIIFRSARSVMAIGGSCASGGPYVVANPCPKGVGWLMVVSIMGGIALVLIMSVTASRVGAPDVAWLAWPALFLSLGWNFWEFGLDPPSGQGTDVGWIVCGVLFVAMGAGPVLLALAGLRGSSDSRPGRAVAQASSVGAQVRLTTTPPPFRPADGSGSPADLVDALERLDALHRNGALSAEEYAAAKRMLLGGSR